MSPDSVALDLILDTLGWIFLLCSCLGAAFWIGVPRPDHIPRPHSECKHCRCDLCRANCDKRAARIRFNSGAVGAFTSVAIPVVTPQRDDDEEKGP